MVKRIIGFLVAVASLVVMAFVVMHRTRFSSMLSFGPETASAVVETKIEEVIPSMPIEPAETPLEEELLVEEEPLEEGNE